MGTLRRAPLCTSMTGLNVLTRLFYSCTLNHCTICNISLDQCASHQSVPESPSLWTVLVANADAHPLKIRTQQCPSHYFNASNCRGNEMASFPLHSSASGDTYFFLIPYNWFLLCPKYCNYCKINLLSLLEHEALLNVTFTYKEQLFISCSHSSFDRSCFPVDCFSILAELCCSRSWNHLNNGWTFLPLDRLTSLFYIFSTS